MLGRLLDYASGNTSVYRAFHVFGDCWHSVGPALVLIVAGAQVFSWDDWPIYVVALLAQFAFDFAATALRALAHRRHLAAGEPAPDGARLRRSTRALAPIGLFATVAAISVGPA